MFLFVLVPPTNSVLISSQNFNLNYEALNYYNKCMLYRKFENVSLGPSTNCYFVFKNCVTVAVLFVNK